MRAPGVGEMDSVDLLDGMNPAVGSSAAVPTDL